MTVINWIYWAHYLYFIFVYQYIIRVPGLLFNRNLQFHHLNPCSYSFNELFELPKLLFYASLCFWHFLTLFFSSLQVVYAHFQFYFRLHQVSLFLFLIVTFFAFQPFSFCLLITWYYFWDYPHWACLIVQYSNYFLDSRSQYHYSS